MLLFQFQLYKKENFVDIINSPKCKEETKKTKKKHYDKNEQNFWIIKIEKSINSVIKGRDGKKKWKKSIIKLMHEISRILSHDICNIFYVGVWNKNNYIITRKTLAHKFFEITLITSAKCYDIQFEWCKRKCLKKKQLKKSLRWFLVYVEAI